MRLALLDIAPLLASIQQKALSFRDAQSFVVHCVQMTGFIISQIRCEAVPNLGRCWHRDSWGQAVEFVIAYLKNEYGVECDRAEIETDFGVEVETPFDGYHWYAIALIEPE